MPNMSRSSVKFPCVHVTVMANFNVKLKELLQHFSWNSEIQGYEDCPESSSHFAYLENRSRGLDIIDSQSEETLLRIREQSLSRGASQSAVRRRWLSLCTVWPSHSHISSLLKAILALGKTRSRRQPNLGRMGANRPGRCDFVPKESLHVGCRMGRRIDADSLICSLGHCKCDGHTVHKFSQRRLTADWLAPRESD